MNSSLKNYVKEEEEEERNVENDRSPIREKTIAANVNWIEF